MGHQLEPILLGLQRWGASSPSFSPGMPVGCDAVMLALKNAFDGTVAGDLAMVVEIRFPLGTFGVKVRDGSIDLARGPADSPDVTLETDPPTLEHLAFFGLAVDDAERRGALVVHGNRTLVPRFLDLFPVPEA